MYLYKAVATLKKQEFVFDMVKKIHQPHDKDFKFKYKRMGLKIHNSLFGTNYKTIEFLDTQEAETGKREDIVYILDGKDAFHVEGESTPITPDDTKRFRGYNEYIVRDKSNSIDSVYSYSICTAKPREPVYYDIEGNFTFALPVGYTQNIDGAKVLITLKDKIDKHETLTDDDQANLLFLADSTIDMPIRQLMEEISYIIRNADISIDDYKDLVACFTQTFRRFFIGDELSEMLALLHKQNEDEKIATIIEKYGMGFDDFYKDGKYDGKIEGRFEGKVEAAENCLKMGMDEDTISQITGFSITIIKKIKRKL